MSQHEKLNKICERFGSPFVEQSFPKEQSIRETLDGFAEEKPVCVAGRLITKREHGKSSFAHISDYSGKIQLYAQRDVLNEQYQLFKELDIGDIIGVKGKLFITRTGEITVLAQELVLLAKALQPLPEKWHGLKNVEVRYRQRYLDLISNAEVMQVFLNRSKIVSFIRDFFNQRNYVEVETPVLHAIPGGASGQPFKTHYNAIDSDMYLRIAPELYLKRLLVGGLDRVYEINKSFRNEGISTRHSPEFTMLEAYCSYENVEYMMSLCEELISSLAQELHSSTIIEYQGATIDLSPPWPRISFAQLFEREFCVVPQDSQDEVLKKVQMKLKLSDGLSRTQILGITEELIEKYYPQGKPAFIVDFFTWTSPLAKQQKDNPFLVDRFELFVAGLEVANAYSELNDPIEQRQRFQKQLQVEEELPKKIDQDFLLSLEYGMPPAAGLGIGIDRLMMILLNQPSIKDVILFPHQKVVSTD